MGHLLSNGFEVVAVDMDPQQLSALRARHGVPQALSSCHTALVEGYVIEGHVPAEVITSLLSERPDVIGLAVPGMPPGSPGMEGGNSVPFDILAFTRDGEVLVFARR